MAVNWVYTDSTNTAVVTGGTSGTPATFASFVTWDRSGTSTLKAATAGAKAMTLTYQIRPVELRALKITFTIASKTAEKDYIYVTGTNFRDDPLYECIDVSAANPTYTTTQYFRTITKIDCEDVGDGSGTAWADGTVAVTQPQWGAIWDLGSSHYKIDSHFQVGNGSTSTFFSSIREMVTFSTAVDLSCQANGTLQLGEILSSYGTSGSFWSIDNSGYESTFTGNGTINIYGSIMEHRATQENARIAFPGGTVNINQSILMSTWSTNYPWWAGFRFNGATYSLVRAIITNVYTFLLDSTPLVATDVKIHYASAAIQVQSDGVTFSNLQISGAINVGAIIYDVISGSFGFYVINPNPSLPSVVMVGSSADYLLEKYSFDLNVSDKNGSPLPSAIISCIDKNSTSIFSTSTDANGNINQQVITYKRWNFTSNYGNATQTTYSPHTFTISKAGYQTLVLENITVNAPIVWHLELQQVMVQNFSKHVFASWS